MQQSKQESMYSNLRRYLFTILSMVEKTELKGCKSVRVKSESGSVIWICRNIYGSNTSYEIGSFSFHSSPEPVFKIIKWKTPVVPTVSTFFASRLKESTLSLDSVCYLFRKKGWVFQKESTLYGSSYYEKEEGRPYPISVHIFHSIHWRQYKGNREPQFSLWKSLQPPPSPHPPTAQKRESTRKNSVHLPRILQNCVYAYC